jgi:tetratricopeptide (TPR) repeat protein
MRCRLGIICGLVAIALLPGSPTRADAVDELLARAAVLDVELKASDALTLYINAEKLRPDDVRALLGIARQYRHLMADATDPQEKLRLGGISLDYAKRAASIAPDDSEAQLSPAISYGKLLPLESNGVQVDFSRRIKAAADKALSLDAGNDLAWHVLGRWCQGYAELTGVRRMMGQMLYGKLPSPTESDAAKCFEKAIAANPNRLMHYIELGRTYAKMGRTAEARRLIQKGLSMPSVEKEDPEVKQRGRETLAALH